jgi:predicted peptidase
MGVTKAAEFQPREFTASSGFVLKYRLLVPDEYDASKSYPVVIFFHGGQQRLQERWEPATRTGAMFCGSDSRQAQHPCFVVVPWSSPETNWGSVFENGPSKTTLAAIEVLDQLELEFNIDKRREYVTGLSGGGKGTWIALLAHPGRFAAAVPLCARQAVDPKTAELTQYANLVKDLPIWMWHGAQDPKNDPENSRRMFAALKSIGAPARYTEVPDAPHNCWDTAYSSDELHAWLFAQRLPDSVAVDTASRAQRRDAIAELKLWTDEKDPEEGAGRDPGQRTRRGARAVAPADK